MQLTGDMNSSFQSSTLIQIYSDDTGEDDGQIVIKDEHNNSITYNYIFCDDDGDNEQTAALRHEPGGEEANYYDLADESESEDISDNLKVVDDIVHLLDETGSFASNNVKLFVLSRLVFRARPLVSSLSLTSHSLVCMHHN